VIKNLQNTEDYEGRYTCIASSKAGKTEAAASLTVDGKSMAAYICNFILLY
jgi:hypothetical protein